MKQPVLRIVAASGAYLRKRLYALCLAVMRGGKIRREVIDGYLLTTKAERDGATGVLLDLPAAVVMGSPLPPTIDTASYLSLPRYAIAIIGRGRDALSGLVPASSQETYSPAVTKGGGGVFYDVNTGDNSDTILLLSQGSVRAAADGRLLSANMCSVRAESGYQYYDVLTDAAYPFIELFLGWPPRYSAGAELDGMEYAIKPFSKESTPHITVLRIGQDAFAPFRFFPLWESLTAPDIVFANAHPVPWAFALQLPPAVTTEDTAVKYTPVILSTMLVQQGVPSDRWGIALAYAMRFEFRADATLGASDVWMVGTDEGPTAGRSQLDPESVDPVYLSNRMQPVFMCALSDTRGVAIIRYHCAQKAEDPPATFTDTDSFTARAVYFNLDGSGLPTFAEVFSEQVASGLQPTGVNCGTWYGLGADADGLGAAVYIGVGYNAVTGTHHMAALQLGDGTLSISHFADPGFTQFNPADTSQRLMPQGYVLGGTTQQKTFDCVTHIGARKYVFPVSLVDAVSNPDGYHDFSLALYDAEADAVDLLTTLAVNLVGVVLGGDPPETVSRTPGRVTCTVKQRVDAEGVVTRHAVLIASLGSARRGDPVYNSNTPAGYHSKTWISYDSGATWVEWLDIGSARGAHYVGNVAQGRNEMGE